MKHLIFLISIVISFAQAQEANKTVLSWDKTIKPYSVPALKKLKPVKLEYRLSWKGAFGAGALTFEFNKKDKRYPGVDVTQTYGKSSGIAGRLFPYNFNCTTFTRSKDSKPVLFVATETDKDDTETTKNTFSKKGVKHESKEVPTKKGKGKASSRSYLFPFANTHDITSAMQYVRRQPLKNGDQINLALNPFDSPMYGQFSVTGREMHNGKMCIKINGFLYRINPKTLALKPYKKLDYATLWISDDADRIMMELRAKIWIGDVRAVLNKKTNL